MVSINLSHFVLGIIAITLLGLGSSDAFSNKGIKNVVNEAEVTIMVHENQEISSIKEINDAVSASAEEEEFTKIGGRKVMINYRRQLKEGDEKNKKINEEVSKKNSGATSMGNSRSVPDLMKINPTGFMDLNADYHMPTPHPPKNN